MGDLVKDKEGNMYVKLGFLSSVRGIGDKTLERIKEKLLEKNKDYSYDGQMLDINNIYCGNNLKLMKGIENNSIDSVVTDPPYNLGFMGKDWDTIGTPKSFQDWNRRWASLVYQKLKPGGYMIVFGGTRTYHRMVAGVEDAGFEVRDMIEWMYGTGFPNLII